MTFSSLDTKVITTVGNGNAVITSPNMSFVPEPHTEPEELWVRADGRFGTTNCFQWPQTHCKEFEYTVCVPCQECHPFPSELAWAWYMPCLEDINVEPHCAFVVGKLKEDKALGVTLLYTTVLKCYTTWKENRGVKTDIGSKLIQSLQHTTTVLLQHPLILCDVVAYVAQAQ